MTTPSHSDFTKLLDAYADGEEEALSALFQAVFSQLRGLARDPRHLGVASEELETRTLVQECSLKLTEESAGIDQRGPLLAVLASALRHLIVDYARSRSRRETSGESFVPDADELLVREETELVLRVAEKLESLRVADPRLVTVLECRFFAGLSAAETADVVGVSASTVESSWRSVQHFLAADSGDVLARTVVG